MSYSCEYRALFISICEYRALFISICEYRAVIISILPVIRSLSMQHRHPEVRFCDFSASNEFAACIDRTRGDSDNSAPLSN